MDWQVLSESSAPLADLTRPAATEYRALLGHTFVDASLGLIIFSIAQWVRECRDATPTVAVNHRHHLISLREVSSAFLKLTFHSTPPPLRARDSFTRGGEHSASAARKAGILRAFPYRM